ncbi:MAG: hypothetical protein ABIG40_01830 [Parcubacteria group bacterium]
MVLWAKAGVSILQTIIYVVFCTSISLTLTYFGTSWLEELLIKKKFIKKKTVERFLSWVRPKNNNFQISTSETRTPKLKKWLTRRKDWQILFLGFVPYIPIMPTGVIIAVSATKIKHGFFILILGNIVRNVISCATVYFITRFFPKIFP